MDSLPKILLIYTGGTIGMMKDFETGALSNFDFSALIDHIPELNLLSCEIETVSFDNPIDSSNMHPDQWRELALIIKENYSRFDGFVVLHGSDTMSYSASALSFMLQGLTKPVIFTGSQLPIGDLRTDAKENLITSIEIAAEHENGKPKIQEVGLYFEYKLYRGNRTTKINAEHFEAFESLNFPPLVESGVHLSYNPLGKHHFKGDSALKVYNNMETNIVLVKLYPGLSAETFSAMTSAPGLRGVILETFGAGNAPTVAWFLNHIRALIQKEIAVVNVTQCSGGSVSMGDYATSVELKRLGVISGKDITTEAAVCKLMYLLGRGDLSSDLKTAFETPCAGEMN